MLGYCEHHSSEQRSGGKRRQRCVTEWNPSSGTLAVHRHSAFTQILDSSTPLVCAFWDNATKHSQLMLQSMSSVVLEKSTGQSDVASEVPISFSSLLHWLKKTLPLPLLLSLSLCLSRILFLFMKPWKKRIVDWRRKDLHGSFLWPGL